MRKTIWQIEYCWDGGSDIYDETFETYEAAAAEVADLKFDPEYKGCELLIHEIPDERHGR